MRGILLQFHKTLISRYSSNVSRFLWKFRIVRIYGALMFQTTLTSWHQKASLAFLFSDTSQMMVCTCETPTNSPVNRSGECLPCYQCFVLTAHRCSEYSSNIQCNNGPSSADLSVDSWKSYYQSGLSTKFEWDLFCCFKGCQIYHDINTVILHFHNNACAHSAFTVCSACTRSFLKM